MTKIGWWYNSSANCCLSVIPQRSRCCRLFFFAFFFLSLSFFLSFSTQIAINTRRERERERESTTRSTAIFVLLSVSPHIPTTSISILSSIYSLFYACLNYMCTSTTRDREKEHLFFFVDALVINKIVLVHDYFTSEIWENSTTERRKAMNMMIA